MSVAVAVGRHNVDARSDTAEIQVAKSGLCHAVCQALEAQIQAREWQHAVQLALGEGRLTEAEISRGLEMTRSTVNRWAAGETEPPSVNMPKLGQKLVGLVRAKLA